VGTPAALRAERARQADLSADFNKRRRQSRCGVEGVRVERKLPTAPAPKARAKQIFQQNFLPPSERVRC
jgi:hypothetical protein